MTSPERYPTYDKWGILNWARNSNRALWDIVPSARKMMILGAAVRRWSEHYQHRSTVFDFMDYANWLHENLAAETEGWT